MDYDRRTDERIIVAFAAVLIAHAGCAQVLVEKPKVSAELEPMIRELLQVTRAPQRVASTMRTILSFDNFRSPGAIPADDFFDKNKTQAALDRVSETQNRMYKRLGELILKDANLEEAAWYVYAPLYGEGWTADELRSMIGFYRTPLGQKIIERDPQFHLWEQIRAMEFFGERIRASRQQVEREEMLKSNPARVATKDMRLLGIAIEVYALDHDELYPTETDAAKLQKLIDPPEHSVVDPWGTAFRFEFSSDRKHYRIISAGSDRKFDVYDAPWGSKPRIVETPGADIVYEDGVFVFYPLGATDQRM